MKLITTIYLAIGIVLVMLSIVTFGYIQQTKEVKQSIAEVLETSNIIRESEQAQKLIIDMETGLRGYLLTGRKVFLEPYDAGKVTFAQTIARLDSITKDYKVQNQLVRDIKDIATHWQTTFSEPLIKSRASSHLGHSFKAHYDSVYSNTVLLGVGKGIMDKARNKFDLLEKEEELLQASRLKELDSSLQLTNIVAIGLTLLSIAIGGFLAYVLGRTIRNRFQRMNNLALSIAQGKYDVSLTDHKHDEISGLTHSLNIMAEKLQSSFTHLTKVNQELDQFAYVVSHDLKAPLRAINNLAEWIEEDLQTDDKEILQNFSTLRGRVHRMENLINGILEYSRIGRKALPTSTFSVQDMLKEVLENLAPPASFTVKASTELPVITAERTLFYQVLSNLLSNAFKYHHTQQGNIEIRAKELPSHYLFEVQDDGPGIPKEYQQKVFTIFQTMEARDVKESTGVGLSIVKKIVEEKGGQIWIDSDGSSGTTFLFTWPKSHALTSTPPKTSAS
ncbi:HAMP domain-containing protein [Rufibacter immobilis]|uniref:histidine kinase n=1 Tax=Rufibacter immobilis TaxID=1348778 RepID=A0A3M9MT12_9BACT|nr:ATP-binding protein [Rufibacter immobilis]RNI28043.1 HAMP domain-containing protein [Rufibacter immobilis]